MQLEILRAIQSLANPVLDVLFEAFTMLGEQIVLALVFCTVYWCFNKQLGKFLIGTLCASLCLNGLLKDIFRAPRPIGEPGIISRRTQTATGYSFPSGHAQSAAAFWSALALWLRKHWFSVTAALLIAAVCLSRLYLGVHYPLDVLGGTLCGTAVSVGFYLLMRKTKGYHALFAVGAVITALSLLLGSSDDTLGAMGMLAGAFVGCLLEERLVNFSTGTSLPRKLLRLGVGLAVIGLLYILPKILLPHTAFWSALHYALIAFAACGGYPWIFSKLRF